MSDFHFNSTQLSIIEKFGFTPESLSSVLVTLPTIVDELVALLEVTNGLYRAGFPVIDDQKYDAIRQSLIDLEPSHPFVNSVEPELVVDSKTVALPQKMLSTDKAYSFEEIGRWINRLKKAASEIDVDDGEIEIRVTPKLDGYAAYDDGTRLYTRGDGVRGQDITRAFERGLQVANNAGRGLGAGEIVIKKATLMRCLVSTSKIHGTFKRLSLLRKK
ncbi:hypothetical protein KUL49_36330 [Alteromonas sp. KUL49]|nr:hypothetical protein KUL49_36330 [Alteromonas sp. KUL49]